MVDFYLESVGVREFLTKSRKNIARQIRIHSQRDRRARTERSAQEFIRRGSDILASQSGALVGVELMMTGRDRDRVIRRAYARTCVCHGFSSILAPRGGAPTNCALQLRHRRRCRQWIGRQRDELLIVQIGELHSPSPPIRLRLSDALL